jgi:hypothetical protein
VRAWGPSAFLTTIPSRHPTSTGRCCTTPRGSGWQRSSARALRSRRESSRTQRFLRGSSADAQDQPPRRAHPARPAHFAEHSAGAAFRARPDHRLHRQAVHAVPGVRRCSRARHPACERCGGRCGGAVGRVWRHDGRRGRDSPPRMLPLHVAEAGRQRALRRHGRVGARDGHGGERNGCGRAGRAAGYGWGPGVTCTAPRGVAYGADREDARAKG